MSAERDSNVAGANREKKYFISVIRKCNTVNRRKIVHLKSCYRLELTLTVLWHDDCLLPQCGALVSTLS